MSDTTRPDGLPRLIEVKVDVELHGGKEPKSESQRLTWEVLDTVWKLMREYSVRVTLAEIRDQLAERGETFPSDEELFKDARESGDPEAPTGYLDLAPSPELAGMGLQGAFDLLATEAFHDAAHGMGFAIGEPGE